MNRIVTMAVIVAVFGIYAGCEPYDPKPPKKSGGGWHPPKPVEPSAPVDEPKPEPQPKPPKDEPPTPTGPAVPEQPKQVGELPYAKAVAGKPGFVTSPYDPYKGYIDVRGFPPGTEVKDPYSGKTFLVPPF
jgi:outer membrane biosynthesis protein TonB